MRFLHDFDKTRSLGSLPVIFLQGWGFDGRVLQLAERTSVNWWYPDSLLDPAGFQAEFLAALADAGIERFVLAGWSMGAHLALDFAKLHPERIVALYLLSMRQHWPKSEIDEIRQDLHNSPQKFLRAFYRKCFWGHRQAYQSFEETLMSDYLTNLDLDLLDNGLDYLGRTEGSGSNAGMKVVQLHGGKDLIAPFKEHATLNGVQLRSLPHVGHPAFLARQFHELISRHDLSPRKTEIRKRFSKAAATYDGHAQTQKETAWQLDNLLADLAAGIDKVLEVGCGTGTYTQIVSRRFPGAQILSLDFSATMIDEARQRLVEHPQVSFLCQDAEDFLQTAGDCSFDLVTSNATLQWFDDFEAAIVGIARILMPGGHFIGSMFGPESLGELAQGLSAVWGKTFSIPAAGFPDLGTIKTTLTNLFDETDIAEIRVLRQYNSLDDLLSHMRKTGTTGGMRTVRPFLTRARLQEVDAWFVREKGGYVLTHQIFLIRGRKEA